MYKAISSSMLLYTYGELSALLESLNLGYPVAHSVVDLRIVRFDRAVLSTKSRVFNWLGFLLSIFSILLCVLRFIIGFGNDVALSIELLNLDEFLALPSFLLFFEDFAGTFFTFGRRGCNNFRRLLLLSLLRLLFVLHLFSFFILRLIK